MRLKVLFGDTGDASCLLLLVFRHARIARGFLAATRAVALLSRIAVMVCGRLNLLEQFTRTTNSPPRLSSLQAKKRGAALPKRGIFRGIRFAAYSSKPF